MGIDAAGVGDFRDQAIYALDVVGGNIGQLASQLRVINLVEHIECAAQAGERIFDFVGDICGKALHRVDPLAQGGGHVGKGAGQQTDFIAPLGQPGHHHRTLAPQPHPHGRAHQQAQRIDYGARQKQREEYRYQQRDPDHIGNALAGRPHL